MKKDGSLLAWAWEMGDAVSCIRNGNAYKTDEGVKYMRQTNHSVFYINENDQLWYFSSVEGNKALP